MSVKMEWVGWGWGYININMGASEKKGRVGKNECGDIKGLGLSPQNHSFFPSFVVHLNKSEIGFSITLATCAFHYVACDGGGGVEGSPVTVEIKT